jgi:hypothetical protein
MSVVPPGAKGTTILTGLLGHVLCDQASELVHNKATAARLKTGRRVKRLIIWFTEVSFTMNLKMMPRRSAKPVAQANKSAA